MWMARNLKSTAPRTCKRKQRPAYRPVLEYLENRVVPANVSWVVNGDGFWDLGSNWSTGMVPGPKDDVTINQPGPLTVTVRDAEAVHSVQTSVHDSLALTGGSFAVST